MITIVNNNRVGRYYCDNNMIPRTHHHPRRLCSWQRGRDRERDNPPTKELQQIKWIISASPSSVVVVFVGARQTHFALEACFSTSKVLKRIEALELWVVVIMVASKQQRRNY